MSDRIVLLHGDAYALIERKQEKECHNKETNQERGAAGISFFAEKHRK